MSGGPLLQCKARNPCYISSVILGLWDKPYGAGLLMPLSLRERLTMLMPPSVFYRQRIAQEARTGEPELAVLAELVPRGGIAVDVGANVGFFSYALADIADHVVAFEPNPDYAFFARWMLRGRAEVRELCAFGRVRP